MQHRFGRPLHRTTVWRRRKAFERGAEVPPDWKPGPTRGRGLSEELWGESYLRFTAAVIHNVNESGHCDYGSIWQREKPADSRFRYRDVPVSLFQRLVDSGFQPAMLAVAVCKVVPLNFRTRVGAKPNRLA